MMLLLPLAGLQITWLTTILRDSGAVSFPTPPPQFAWYLIS